MKRVAAGIIVCNNKILIAQRKRGKDLEYFWEFPGGKIEPGETCEECLHREIMEEFNLEIRVGKFFMETSYDYSFGTFVLEVYFAACPDPEIPELFEHEQARWVDVEDLPEYNKTVLRLISRQQGVGGRDSWGAHCSEIYKNKTDRTYRLKFQIRF